MGSETPTEDEPLARPIRDCVQTIFPTPVAVHEWPDSAALNTVLAEAILAEEATTPSRSRSNVGGWHSPMDYLTRQEVPQMRLMGRIRRMVGELTGIMMKPGRHRFQVEGWANVLRHGQYTSLHVHPNSTWSGVYHVTGNPPPQDGHDPQYSGKIEFTDPRPAASATCMVENVMQRRCMLNPGPGTMIAFPSWLQHQVHPYFGPVPRISIAFNVVVAG